MSNAFLRQLISGASAPGAVEFHGFLDRIAQGGAVGQEVAVFLAGLSAKPLSATSACNFVSYVHRVSPPGLLPGSEGAVNIVGTGGGISTFNISTAAAFVASAAGARVLKSGSTAYSSKCGSLEVLRALKVPVPAKAAMLADMVGELGIAFIPASHYAPLLRRMAALILPLAWRDVAGFINTIGPLLCPYQVAAQVIGVSRLEYLNVFTDAITRLALPKTLLVHADSGMDEFSSIATNHCRLIDGCVQRLSLPEQFGFAPGAAVDLAGGDVTENVAILRAVLAGRHKGAARDTVVLNSAALLFVAGVASSFELGIQRSADAIDDGRALAQLELVAAWGRKLASRPSVSAA